MKTTVHIISHSHWDREWYMAFEKHRMKLVELLDTASDLLENNENYRSFHMDGHTAAYDDYLEIKPEQKERIPSPSLVPSWRARSRLWQRLCLK